MINKNIIFIWIPKTAGTSLYENLQIVGFQKQKEKNEILIDSNKNNLITFGHMDYFLLLKKGYVDQEFNSNSFKFAFVRNPLDRFVSLYFYLKKCNIVKDSFDGFVDKVCNKKISSIGLYNRQGFSQCNPQYHWLKEDVDFIGKFENIELDYKKLCLLLGIDYKPLPLLNKIKHDSYLTYYTPETEKRVTSFYQKDFELFGY